MRDAGTIIESMKLKLNKESMNNVFNDKIGKRHITSDEAEYKAQKLVEKYNAPQSRNFFLKCVYHLSEHDIEDAVELSMKPWVKSPIKYFVKVCYSRLNG